MLSHMLCRLLGIQMSVLLVPFWLFQVSGSSRNAYSFRGDVLDLLPPKGELTADRVIVEVGTHECASSFHLLDEDPSLIVIGIEPNPAVGINHPTHPRFYLLPVAIADVSYSLGADPPRVKFWRTRLSGCSSLKRPSRNAAARLCAGQRFCNCTTESGRLWVPVIPLAPILERAASYGPIMLLQVDAQGTDAEVVESGGAQLTKFVNRLVLECQDPPGSERDYMLYKGQPTKEEIESRLVKLGFYLERCWHNNEVIGEKNCVFAQSSVFLRIQQNCFDSEFVAKVGAHLRRNAPSGSAVQDPTQVLIGRICCHGDALEAMAMGCWDGSAYTKQTCCIDEYFLAAGLPKLPMSWKDLSHR